MNATARVGLLPLRLLLCLIGVLLVVPAAAQAGTAAVVPSTPDGTPVLTYGAGPGEVLDVTVTAGGGQYVVADAANAMAAGSGCAATADPHKVTCAAAGVQGVSVVGGPGGDRVVLDPSVTVPASLEGGEGADLLTGGSGDDTISGGGGADVLVGGAGDDTIGDLAGGCQIAGGDGDDTLNGCPTIDGGAGNDTIAGTAGDDRLMGGDGADVISGLAGNDRIDGGSGNDTLVGGPGDDMIHGGAGDDRIDGDLPDLGLPQLNGGKDVLYGDDGDDVIAGEAGDDTIDGGAGDDRLTGTGWFSPDDCLCGQPDGTYDGSGTILSGNDTLTGDDGNDVLIGGDGADVLQGGAGNDRVAGGPGADALSGGPGADRIVSLGDHLADILTCGDGDDVVEADRVDDVSSLCERVDYPLDAPPPPGVTAPPGIQGPLPGQTQVVAATDGTVLARRPGGSFQTVDQSQQVLNGSEVDATDGAITLFVAEGAPDNLRAIEVKGGRFTVRQRPDRTETDLSLSAPLACSKAADARARSASVRRFRGVSATVARAARARSGDKRTSHPKPAKPQRARSIFTSTSKGQFTTKGSDASASVRGTRWVTIDDCSGTTVFVFEGMVDVTDADGKVHTITGGHGITVRRTATARRAARH